MHLISPFQIVDYSNPDFLTYYYTSIALIAVFLYYWYIIRKGYVIHIMQPLGNVSATQAETITEFDYENPETHQKEHKVIKNIVKGNTGVYHEIAKKKVTFSMAGRTVNFFADPRKPTSNQTKGISVFIDNTGVSYLHRGNKHIYFDSVSMTPIKLQSGTFNPDSHAWYKFFELGFLERVHKSTSSAPPKTKSSNTTLAMVLVVGILIGYFLAIMYGHQLSPALFPPNQIPPPINSTSFTKTITSSTSILIGG